MPTLSSELRSKLERVVIEARDVAEAGARATMEALAVYHHEPYPQWMRRVDLDGSLAAFLIPAYSHLSVQWPRSKGGFWGSSDIRSDCEPI